MNIRTTDSSRQQRQGRSKAAALALAALLATAPLTLTDAAWAAAPSGFADLIEGVAPAVVQITARQTDSGDNAQGDLSQIPEQFRDGPLRDFFEHFFGENGPGRGQGPQGQRTALGSGFIISADGIVVTNNHVIGESDKMEVTLKDGSRFPARLVGSDDKTDLAVIKIEADRSLPTVPWGDSDHARVGDWVVAVGNPFGLAGTATAGIVSSRGRDIGAGPYDDFIQIDAPINTGNSGGPLFDGDGKVIGVNTAIYSPTGGSVGIGFAIPSNAARKVVAELQDKGTVSRGWLGVAIQPVTPEVAESLGLAKAEGALVASVTPSSPAAKASLKQGDVIVSFDGKAIASPRELSRAVADAEIGEKGKLMLWRDGREMEVRVNIGEMPKQLAAAEPGQGKHAPEKGSKGGLQLGSLGLTLSPLDDATRSRWGVSESTSGALVSAVDDRGNAADKGLQPGDVITRVNQEAVKSPKDVAEAVEKAKAAQRKTVLLLIERRGTQQFVAVELSRA
ncbi:MAG: Do family serine endopeptidase [Rhodospirillales bacterium]